MRAGAAGPPVFAMNQLRQAVQQALYGVIEPDLGENIVDLGLVRALRVARSGVARIDITMTTPHSPAADALVGEVRRAAERAGALGAEVRLVWQPPWTPYDMAPPLRALLGLPDREPRLPPMLARPALWRWR